MKCISLNLFILLLFLLMPGCIKEDITECPSSTLQLRFRYTLNNEYTNLFGSDVSKVTVYIFGSDNKYVDTFTQSGDILTNDYIMSIPLPEGSYHAVVFGGDQTTYSSGELNNQTNTLNNELTKGVTLLNDFRLMLNNTEGQEGYLVPTDIPDDLYAGHAADVTSSLNTTGVTDIELIKDTKRIKVEITGLDQLTRATVVPDVYITAINGRYKYENSVDEAHRMFKYTPVNSSTIGNTMETNLKVMRLIIGQSPMLVIKNPSAPGFIYNQNMIEQILFHPKYKEQEDIDREDEFLFEINISQTDNNVVISVTINGWKVNDIIPVIN